MASLVVVEKRFPPPPGARRTTEYVRSWTFLGGVDGGTSEEWPRSPRTRARTPRRQERIAIVIELIGALLGSTICFTIPGLLLTSSRDPSRLAPPPPPLAAGGADGAGGEFVQQPLHEQPMAASWSHVPKALTSRQVACAHGLRQGSLPGGAAGGSGGGGVMPSMNEPMASQNSPQSL